MNDPKIESIPVVMVQSIFTSTTEWSHEKVVAHGADPSAQMMHMVTSSQTSTIRVPTECASSNMTCPSNTFAFVSPPPADTTAETIHAPSPRRPSSVALRPTRKTPAMLAFRLDGSQQLSQGGQIKASARRSRRRPSPEKAEKR